jgi:hypothetical protein
MNSLGKIVTVVGKVTEVFSGKTQDGKPHLFLNFGNWRGRCFTVVLWGDAYDEIIKQKIDFNSLLNNWISSTGIITSYKHRPQIAFSSLIGFELLTSETEAKYRLGFTQDNPKFINSPIHYKKNVTISDPNSIEIEVEENNANALGKNEYKIFDDKKIREYQFQIQKRIDELYSNLPLPKNK